MFDNLQSYLSDMGVPPYARRRPPSVDLEPPLKRSRNLAGDPAGVRSFPASDVPYYNRAAWADYGPVEHSSGSFYRRLDVGLGETGSSVAYGPGPMDLGPFCSDRLLSSQYGRSHSVLEGNGPRFGGEFEPGKPHLLGSNSVDTGVPEFWSAGMSNAEAEPKADGTRGQMYKSKLCKLFQAGQCKYNESCTFAHNVEKPKKLPHGSHDAVAPTASTMLNEGAGSPVSGSLDGELEAEENKGVLFKTKLCKHIQVGECSFNGTCSFAHSIEELRNVPAEAEDARERKASMFKTKLCKQFQTGDCIYNDSCSFAHGMEELMKPPAEGVVTLTGISRRKGDPSMQMSIRGEFPKVNGSIQGTGIQSDWKKFQKTKTCKFFVEGNCPFGDKCSFVHGDDERKHLKGKARSAQVREVVAGGKFDWRKLQKTKPCKFFIEGRCPYGDKCSFLHDKEENEFGQENAGLAEADLGGKFLSSNPRHKTRLCTLWVKGEPCDSGNNCSFAHGAEELQKYGAEFIDLGRNVPLPHISVSGDIIHMRDGANAFPNIPGSDESIGTTSKLFATSKEGVRGFARDYDSQSQERERDSGIVTVRQPTHWSKAYGQSSEASPWSAMYTSDGGYFSSSSSLKAFTNFPYT